jgi:purine-nucleoside phosphorylase
MGEHKAHALDASIRSASKLLRESEACAPEVLMLLATGTSDVAPLLEERHQVSLNDLASAPEAWRGQQLISGNLNGARVWLIEDAPLEDSCSWSRPWPIWLARQCGAGRALLSVGANPLTCAPSGTISEGFFFPTDHLALEGSTPLRGLSTSNLGPLFPDQGAVHDTKARAQILRQAAALGLHCAEGVLACTLGPTLETPAEQSFHAAAGAHASAQNTAGLYHAMAHAGLKGATIAPLLGEGTSSVEELLHAAQRLAPSLLELLVLGVEVLAVNARADSEVSL